MKGYALGSLLIVFGIVVFIGSIVVGGVLTNCGAGLACFYNPTVVAIVNIVNWLEVLGVIICLAGVAALTVQFVSKHTQ